MEPPGQYFRAVPKNLYLSRCDHELILLDPMGLMH